jgi:hypothetical protein
VSNTARAGSVQAMKLALEMLREQADADEDADDPWGCAFDTGSVIDDLARRRTQRTPAA